MTIAGMILKATKEKFEAIDDNTKHPYLQSFGIGLVEGFVDSCMIAGATMVVAVVVQGIVNALSEKR
jgi:hypothetical protein